MYSFSLMIRFSVGIFFIVLISHAGANPSFDCKKAETFTEKRVCAVPTLAELDTKLSKAYSQFFRELPETKRATAKRIQQLWVRGRETWCAELTLKPLLDVLPSGFDSDVSIELDPMPASDKDLCIREYYLNALSSLERGALVSRVFLVQGISSLRIGVSGIDEVEITSPEKSQTDDEYQAYLTQNVVVLHGDQRFVLSQANLVGCKGCVDGATTVPRELRFYLTKDGTLHSALVHHTSNSGGRCGHYEQANLSFFTVDKALAWHTQNDNRPDLIENGINLYHISHTCGMYTEHYHDWQTDKKDLTFIKSEVATAYPHWAILGDLHRFSVRADERQIERLPNVDTSTISLWGISYKKLYLKVEPLIDKEKNQKNRCESVQKAIVDYMNIKSVGISNNISNTQAMFILAHVMNESHVEQMGSRYEVAVEVFLDYLDKMRVKKDWEGKLQSATGRYPEPNHHFFMMPEPDWKVGDNPFIQEGFYSDMGCMRDTASPSFGLEEWVYRFWARRHARGELDAVEAALRNFLKLRKSTSSVQ